MSQLSPLLRDAVDGVLFFWCPGCEMAHQVKTGTGPGPRWDYNGDAEAPTFRPSVLVTWTQGEDNRPMRCHSYVTGGRIEFLGDCTHELAGKTVPLPAWDW